MKTKQLENKLRLRKSRLQVGEPQLWQVKCVLGLHNDAANARSEYSGAGVGKGGVGIGAGQASHLHGQTCPKFCHIFWLISKMQIIDVLADIGARPVAFFDKFASTARAAMCSLQTFCGVEYHGSGGLCTLPSCKTRASRCRSLCFPWTWRRPLICLQLIRIVDVGLLHGSEGHGFTGPCYAKLAFPFPAFVCASLG